MITMFGKKDISVGLDIGTNAVKMVQLLKRKDGTELVSFGSAPFPSEAMSDGVIVDANSVVDAVRKVITENNVKIKEVKVGLSGRSVIAKKIKMPLMTADELKDSIHWEAEQHIPFSIDEVVLDFLIIPDEVNEKLKQMSVLLIAAKKDKIKSYMDILSELNLKAVLVDLDSFAIANSYEASSGSMDSLLNENEVLCFLNIGAEMTNLNVMGKVCPYFVREISVAGNHWTRAIQKEFNVNFNRAEEMKINAMKGGIKTGAEETSVKTVIDNVMEQLVNEIKRSFDYFRGIEEKKEIKKIIISGGTARMNGLVDYFSDTFKISVEIANPLVNIKVDETNLDAVKLRELSPVLGVSVGLALR